MKAVFASFALLLLAACASSSDVIDQRVLPCGSGQEIEIRAAMSDPSGLRESAGPLHYLVEVANNSHEDVTVTAIRVMPRVQDVPDLEENVYREFDQLIPEGEDHLFEIPATEVWVRGTEFERRISGRRLEFVVTVTLSDGDSYRCAFASR